MTDDQKKHAKNKIPKHNPQKNKSPKEWSTLRCKKGNIGGTLSNVFKTLNYMLSIELRKSNQCWCLTSNEYEITDKCYNDETSLYYIKKFTHPCICINVKYNKSTGYVKPAEKCINPKSHDIQSIVYDGCKMVEVSDRCKMCNSITGTSLSSLWSDTITNLCYCCHNKYLKSINKSEMPEWLNVYVPHNNQFIKHINSKLLNDLPPNIYVRSMNLQLWYYSCVFVLDLLKPVFIDDIIKIICDYTNVEPPNLYSKISIGSNIQKSCSRSWYHVLSKHKKKDIPEIEQIKKICKLFIRIN